MYFHRKALQGGGANDWRGCTGYFLFSWHLNKALCFKSSKWWFSVISTVMYLIKQLSGNFFLGMPQTVVSSPIQWTTCYYKSGHYSSLPAEVSISRFLCSGSLPIYFLLVMLPSSPGGNIIIRRYRKATTIITFLDDSIHFAPTGEDKMCVVHLNCSFSFSQTKGMSYAWS